jgi:sugar transferase (PEP-CTERM/EpsH1 system associated)
LSLLRSFSSAVNRRHKRILYINQSMAMGGIESMIVDFARLLPPDEFDPHVAVFESGGSLESALNERRVPLHPLNKREGIDLGLLFRLRRLLRTHGIDVIHSHNYSAWLYAGLAARGLGETIHVHTEHSEVDFFRRRYAAERWLSRMTTHVVAVSKHVHDVMIREVGIHPARVRLIYNGVDTTRFAPNALARKAVRGALNLSRDQIVIGIIARLATIKNHDLLLRAYAPLCRKPNNRARLVIVGDGTERGPLGHLAHQLGIAEHVLFLGERRDTPELLNAFDIYVLPSFNEGMNLTLLEAMSSGLPVVVTNVGGNVEMVEEGVTGYLVPSNDIAALSERLRQLTDAPESRARMGRQGREHILRLFDQQVMMDQYLSLYRAVEAGEA